MSRNLDQITFSFSLLLMAAANFKKIIKYKKALRWRRKRRWSVRPINRQRKSKGFYRNLVASMKEMDESQFFKFTRMSKESFSNLLEKIKPYLEKKSNREPICPEERLLVTLYYLAHGGSMQSVAWAFYLGKTTVSCIIQETCCVLWDVLSPITLPVLNLEQWRGKAVEFSKKWNLPNCCGALDGKHVKIQCPPKSGSEFFNYKKDFSIVLMAICDANYLFTFVDIGAYGSQNDSSIFRQSEFGKQLESGTFKLPPSEVLPNSENILFPHYIAADAAFPLTSYILRPYPGKNLNERKRIFNYRLSRGRRCIENAFGILSSRWRILRNIIITSVSTAENIIAATVCLHNFIMMTEQVSSSSRHLYCPLNYVDHIDNNGLEVLGNWRQDASINNLTNIGRTGRNNAAVGIYEMRDKLADYFLDCGAVSWQWDSINIGLHPQSI